jgi:molybdopterin-guanine dinucleotide biosynthesis protein A
MARAGFVLTGGSSSRMGRDKALLAWGRATLVEHLCEQIRQVTDEVSLVGAPERYAHLNLPCIADLRPGLGPLSGIESALSSTQAEWNLIVACDLPQVDAEIANAVFSRAEERAGQGQIDCIAVRDATGQIHPLCAVYHRGCRDIVSLAIDRGQLRAVRLLDELRTEYLEIGATLMNANVPEQWAAALTESA